MYDPIWVTRDGRRLRIGAMSTDHVKACIARIERMRSWRREFLARLKLELVIRALPRV
jgi:hypothetical protein